MKTKSAERLWKLYPEGHLHCKVTEAGSTVYKIVMSMVDIDGNTAGTIEHIGSGELATLKKEALHKLIMEIGEPVE